MDTLQSIRKQIDDSPEHFDPEPLFVMLEQDGDRVTIRELCFYGLGKNARHTLLRLLLAKTFYLDGLGEFAVRELVELRKYSAAPSLERLLLAFGNFAQPFLSSTAAETRSTEDAEDEDVVAEIDIDTEFGDLLEDLKK